MSLPDTVFIFVLALIIFGPKKLPEIGRQIGKLVGEFRRASNEFKYQIEEEMRQIDIQEKPSPRHSIAAAAADADASEAVQPPVLPEFPADPADSLPVGQHPNIDMLDTSELRHSDESEYYDFDSESGESGMEYGESETASGESEIEPGTSEQAAAAAEPATPIIQPAEGSQPRTTAPFTQKIQDEEAPPAPAEHAHVETEISHG